MMKLNLVVKGALLAVAGFGCGGPTDEPSTVGETGGSSTGGSATGGSSTGGSATGGSATGGSSTGGSATGGSSTGGGSGTSTGGTSGVAGGATGGAGTSTGGAVSSGGAAGSGTGGSSIGGAGTTGGTTNTGGVSATGGTGNTAGAGATGGAAGGMGGTAGAGGTPVCDASWDPPDTANGNTGIPAGLDKEWARSGPDTLRTNNTKIHQMMENGGQMRYCARWDSSSPISAEERQQAAALMANCDRQWTDHLTGWGCWPYSTIDVKIVMWVVRDASLLTDWTDAEGSYVVGTPTNDDATDMACPRDCNQRPGQPPMTSCASGQVYDEFLWLDGDKTDYTGWGWTDGFYMAASHFMTAAKRNATTETIVAHELGHSHTLNDFYNPGETPDGWTSFVMKAGTSQVVTETDGWMLRNVWRHIRSNWGYPDAE